MSKVYLCLACGIGHTSGPEDKFCPQHETGLSPEEKKEILYRYDNDEEFRKRHAEYEAEEEKVCNDTKGEDNSIKTTPLPIDIKDKLDKMEREINTLKVFNSRLLNILRNLYIQQTPEGYATLYMDRMTLDVYMEELINSMEDGRIR